MAETARITTIGDGIAPVQAAQPAENGFSQQPGESALWFRRYLLYRDLGHKRTLRAAVAKERESVHLLKDSESATKSPQTQKEGVQLVNVPGSWKNASKVYRWAERAKGFDAWLLRRMAEETYKHLGDGFANKFRRVQLIQLLIDAALEQMNHASENAAKHETYLAYTKRVAALLAQMEREMSTVNEEEMKAAIVSYGRSIQADIEKAYHAGCTVIARTK